MLQMFRGVRAFGFGIVASSLLFTALASAQAPAVATGDARTVTEPSFPGACQVLQASFHDVNENVPAAVEAVSTSLDTSRVQAALNACAGTNLAVQLSLDGAGNNSFLTGPLTMPSGVTLLVDPGVTLFFSRNAQDYDTTPGTHTCGTVSGASNTASCKNLISINNVSDVGIMGYGKMNARGGDVVLNSFATPGYQGSTAGKTWWDLASDANTLGGAQQNPRWIQITRGTNITFYKITLKNPPNFHIAINFVAGFTAWGIHIVTPYSARNTDGIDPGNATNVTVRDSWISDGDDNIALGANAGPTSNVSIVHNKFFAGHGESIGSLTTYGVNNALYDDNAMYGDADVDGSNSTAIRIKSANDRGGLVQNIQYSNSCFANHGTQMQFTPIYNSNAGTLTPNFKNILLQNLRFSNQGPVQTGSYTFLGASNNGTVNPLGITLDNVTVDTMSASNLVAPMNALITLGPGQVSSNLVGYLAPYSGVNGNVIADKRMASALDPPACSFAFLAPSLTGPKGMDQTVTTGQFPTAVVILQPAIASTSYPYPTGTVTLTDEASRTFTARLGGTGDTSFVPITTAPAGTHTYTASYSGDAVYPAISSFGHYTVNVAGGGLAPTGLVLGGVPASAPFGAGFTATATLASSGNAAGAISFLVNGVVYATVPLSGGQASFGFTPGLGSYAISALYAGDSANQGSVAMGSTVSVTAAATLTTLTSSSATGVVGTPVTLKATVSSGAGVPSGGVVFSYTSSTNSTPATIGTGTLTNGVATFAASLPQGSLNVVATYAASGNFAGSVSAPVAITVSAAPPVPASTAPIALPYTISTLVGGGTSNAACAGHVDSFGDGCKGSDVVLPSGTDLRSVTGDPFGNVYFTDSNASLVRRVSVAGTVTQFAGFISGSACVPTTTAGCTPSLVKLGGKPRGIFGDPLGNLFIAGYGDNKVQFVRAADGKMYLVAGNGSAPSNTTDSGGDGGPAASALLKGPRAIATDAAGNVYIADSGDNRIRVVLNPGTGFPGSGNIQTVAGTGVLGSTGDGGLATAATLNNPQGVAVDGSGNLYIAEGSHVRAVCVTCAAGSGLYALLNKLGVANPVNGNIYSVAGTASSSNATFAPGLGNTVSMAPQKLSLDADGNLYIADSANNVVWFEDGRTGYTRVLAGHGTSCNSSPIGDGCPATQATLGSNGGNGIGVGFDSVGNLYVADSTNLRIRKISNNLRFGSTAVGTPATQTVFFHSQPGDSFSSAVESSPDFALVQAACSTAPDTTQDCSYTLSFAPVVAGTRAAPLTMNTATGNPGVFALAGTGLGGGATLDPAAQRMFGKGLEPNAIAVDPAGNVLVADAASGSVLRFTQDASGAGAGTAAAAVTLGSFTSPAGVAADALGNVFVADGSTGLISIIPSEGATTALATTFTSPKTLAVDAWNNLYVLDAGAKSVTEIGPNGSGAKTLIDGLSAPTSLALDGSGNVYLGDGGSIYKYDAQTLARTTVSTAAATPAAVAVDPAGNVLVADSASGSLLAIPASSNSAPFTLVDSLPGATLALDSTGNVYTGSGAGQVTKLLRTQGLAVHNGSGGGPITVNLLSTGTAKANLTINNPDTTNFKLAVNSSADCMAAGSGAVSVGVGGACALISSFTPSGNSSYSNPVSFVGNAANAALAVPPVLQLLQVGSNTAFPVTVTLGGISPANPSNTDPVTLMATVSSAFGTPNGTVTFAVDGVSLAPVAVSSGSASINAGTLSAGQHAITAAFTSSDSNFGPGSAGPVTITVSGNAAGAVQLVTTSSIAPLPDSSYQVTITVRNNGTGTATAVMLTGVTLGGAAGTPLPVNLGSLPAGASASALVTVPSTAGLPGSATLLRISGSYIGGSFGGSLRAQLP